MSKNKILTTATLAAFLGLTCSCENKNSNTSVPAPPKSQEVSDETLPPEPPRGTDAWSEWTVKLYKITGKKILSECFDETMQSRLGALYDQAKAQNPDKESYYIDPGVYKNCFYGYSQLSTPDGGVSFGSLDPHKMLISRDGSICVNVQYGERIFQINARKSENGWTILNKF